MNTSHQRVAEKRFGEKGDAMLGRVFKVLLFLLVLGGIGLVGYAYLGDLSPTQIEKREPITLNVD